MNKAIPGKEIIRSHDRSRQYGIDPDQVLPAIRFSGDALESVFRRNHGFIEHAQPIVEALLQNLKDEKGYMLILTDGEGIILEVFGDPDEIERAENLNMRKGAGMDEDGMGTNAIGTAIHEGKTIQVKGEEHFARAFHHWTCTAAPVFGVEGVLVGTINLTLQKGKKHPYAMGMIQAAAIAIGDRISGDVIQQQLYDAQQYAFSIMNHLTFGLIVMDLKGRIHWVNDTACRTLNIRRMKLVNRDIRKIYTGWNESQQRVDRGEELLDQEAELLSKGYANRYLVNIYAINNEAKKQIGYVLSFRPMSRMLGLINKYSNTQLSYSFDRIIARSKVMKDLVEYALNVADTPSTILIGGESGTGKEVFAQAIHNASKRREKPFVAINCGAISSSLIESELFGYEEGAFTGASRGGKPGKFELADQGTLFLDEIGEMPLEMQVKLLRVIQDKQVTRIGGSVARKVDVRIIAATNKDLDSEVRQGNFRQDLFYRISVIPITLPPVRQRRMDIPVLYHFFLAQKASRLKRPVPGTDNKLMKALIRYDWPGNVREIENFAEKAVILNGDTSLLLRDVNLGELPPEEEKSLQWSDTDSTLTLEEIEKEAITRYLELFDNNISKTASALGIGRNTLYLKMEKYKIQH